MTLFENVNTITINNKEVQSIITTSGAVLYQKADEEYTGEIGRYVEEFIIKIPSTDISVYGFSIDELLNMEILEEYNLESLNRLFDGYNYDDFYNLITDYGLMLIPIYDINNIDSVIPYDTPISDLNQGVDIAPLSSYEVYSLIGLMNSAEYVNDIYPVTYTATDSTHIIASVNTQNLLFSESTYNATNGSCTITCKLSRIDGDVSGKTITVTGSDGSQYSSITNNNGEGTVQLDNSDGTNLVFTCTYNDVSDICSVIGTLYRTPLSLTYTGEEFNFYPNNDLFNSTDFVIDWGDGSTSVIDSSTPFVDACTHTYASNGTYNIRLIGNISILGNGSKYISNMSATSLTGLTCVKIGSPVTTIRKSFFRNLVGLTSVEMSDTVTTIEDSCFSGCKKISNLIFSTNLTTIGTSCFVNCSSLRNIIIPSNVTSMGARCFYACAKLVDYQLYWETPPVTWSNPLMPTNPNTYFTIPNGTTANYTANNFPSEKLIERSE